MKDGEGDTSLNRQYTPCWVSPAEQPRIHVSRKSAPNPTRRSGAVCPEPRAKVTWWELAAESACEEPLWRWNWWEGRERKGEIPWPLAPSYPTILPTPPIGWTQWAAGPQGLGWWWRQSLYDKEQSSEGIRKGSADTWPRDWHCGDMS